VLRAVTGAATLQRVGRRGGWRRRPDQRAGDTDDHRGEQGQDRSDPHRFSVGPLGEVIIELSVVRQVARPARQA
jgi:hypothetical protein